MSKQRTGYPIIDDILESVAPPDPAPSEEWTRLLGQIWRGPTLIGQMFFGEADAERVIIDHRLAAHVPKLKEALGDMLEIVESEGHVNNYVPQVTAARKVLAEVALALARK